MVGNLTPRKGWDGWEPYDKDGWEPYDKEKHRMDKEKRRDAPM
jgi:hypothetical protein